MRVIFGGTFDPVHNGHLRMAVELSEVLGGPAVHLLPCYQAVHKDDVGANPGQRLEMLRLATQGEDALVIDEREISRQSPSYTIDTLRELRQELNQEPLVLAVGTDSALDMPSWRSFSEYSDLCHVVVMRRPGYERNNTGPGLLEYGFEEAQNPMVLQQQASGLWLDLQLNLLQISSSEIRERVRDGRSIRYLLERAVEAFICDNGLYQTNREGK